jgi:hypothetical protein
MFVLSEHAWDPMASSNVDFCRKTRTVPLAANPLKSTSTVPLPAPTVKGAATHNAEYGESPRPAARACKAAGGFHLQYWDIIYCKAAGGFHLQYWDIIYSVNR